MSVLALLPLLDRLDNAIEKLNELLEKIVPAVAPEAVTPKVTVYPTLTVERLNNRYKVFDIDLSTAHTDEPLGIQDLVTKHGVSFCRYMTIIAVPSAFTYKINDKAADSANAALGAEWEFEIEEIYYSNAALAGTGKIHVEFRVE